MILAALRQRDMLFRTKVWAMMLCGTPLCFFGPLVMSVIVWFACALGIRGEVMSWSAMFLIASAVMIPLLFRLEMRTAGDYLGNMVLETKGAIPLQIPYALGGDWGMLVNFVAAPRQSIAGFMEFFLFGPRLVLSGWRQLRANQRLGAIDFDRAAVAVAQLMRLSIGIDTKELVRPGEQAASLVPTVAYLVLHDWAGVGDNGRRVWLGSGARKRLTAAHS